MNTAKKAFDAVTSEELGIASVSNLGHPPPLRRSLLVDLKAYRCVSAPL